MKTPTLLSDVERRAGRQLNLLLGVARKKYDRFMRSAEKVSDKAAQRRYIRAAEQTMDSAEKIIAQLRKRIAAAKKSLGGGATKKKRKATFSGARNFSSARNSSGARKSRKAAKRILKKRKVRR